MPEKRLESSACRSLSADLRKTSTPLHGNDDCCPGHPSPPPSPGPGSTPLEYLRQHRSLDAPAIDMQAFRPFWKVKSRIDRLHADELISWFEWRCASDFQNLYDKALGSQVKASSLDGTGRGSGYRASLRPSDHQLMALRRLCDLRGRLDRETVRLLEAVIVDELSWCELGKRLRVRACTAKRKAIIALSRLGQVW